MANNNGTATQASLDLDKGNYSIGEVSRMTRIKAFVLRYWETEFPMLEPEKGSNGRRSYRQEDVDLILKIKRLLYDEGFTIAGARRHLREGGAARRGGKWRGDSARLWSAATFEPKNASGYARFAARFLDPSRTPMIALQGTSGRSAVW